MGNLSRLSHAQTRSGSPENLTGEKGKGGMATEGTGAAGARELGQGWKVSPSVVIAPGTTYTVAEINGCDYCRLAHARTAREAALTDQDIRLARKAAAAEPRANAMLRFTQSVVLQRGEISDAELALVRQAGLSESEIIEIIANIALNIFTNYLNIISKTETDFFMPQTRVLAGTN